MSFEKEIVIIDETESDGDLSPKRMKFEVKVEEEEDQVVPRTPSPADAAEENEGRYNPITSPITPVSSPAKKDNSKKTPTNNSISNSSVPPPPKKRKRFINPVTVAVQENMPAVALKLAAAKAKMQKEAAPVKPQPKVFTQVLDPFLQPPAFFRNMALTERARIEMNTE
jgi:hypothetical protein